MATYLMRLRYTHPALQCRARRHSSLGLITIPKSLCAKDGHSNPEICSKVLDRRCREATAGGTFNRSPISKSVPFVFLNLSSARHSSKSEVTILCKTKHITLVFMWFAIWRA